MPVLHRPSWGFSFLFQTRELFPHGTGPRRKDRSCQRVEPSTETFLRTAKTANMGLLQGFVKRDRKRDESMPPDSEDAQSSTDPKRSTEWTLTDEAIARGIQSTTRYRNKKNEGRDRDRQNRHHHQVGAGHILYHPSSHSLRHGVSANRFPGRVSKAHRHGGHDLRAAPTSGFIARTSSPYYQDAFMAHALAGQAQQQQHPTKMDPGVTTTLRRPPPPPPPGTAGSETPYGMMMHQHHHHQGMVHTGPAFDMSAAGGANGQGPPPMYLGPPPPPQGPFPYDTADVNLGYPPTDTTGVAADDANHSARLFDPANMPDGLCDWSMSDHGY